MIVEGRNDGISIESEGGDMDEGEIWMHVKEAVTFIRQLVMALNHVSPSAYRDLVEDIIKKEISR